MRLSPHFCAPLLTRGRKQAHFKISQVSLLALIKLSRSCRNLVAIAVVGKKLNELEFALQACLQHMDIPEVNLVVDDEIRSAAARCDDEGRLLSLEELGLEDKLQNSAYLNGLQVSSVRHGGI
jgi:hypothetical protein